MKEFDIKVAEGHTPLSDDYVKKLKQSWRDVKRVYNDNTLNAVIHVGYNYVGSIASTAGGRMMIYFDAPNGADWNRTLITEEDTPYKHVEFLMLHEVSHNHFAPRSVIPACMAQFLLERTDYTYDDEWVEKYWSDLGAVVDILVNTNIIRNKRVEEMMNHSGKEYIKSMLEYQWKMSNVDDRNRPPSGTPGYDNFLWYMWYYYHDKNAIKPSSWDTCGIYIDKMLDYGSLPLTEWKDEWYDLWRDAVTKWVR